MIASELRIGNWVEFNTLHDSLTDDNWVSEQITIDDFVLSDILDVAYRSIPITEEWLKRFGFVQKNGPVFTLDDGRLRMIFCREEIDDWYVIFRTNYGGEIVELPNINDFRYVHQLQNLYFALTGQELELKQEGDKR